jgi:hypothetical protein
MILRNVLTEETESFDAYDVTEDSKNFFIHGYIRNKYGRESNLLTLPKFLWEKVENEDLPG